MASYNGYNLSPTATNYSSTYGGVPGQIAAPPSIWDQLNQNIPDYGALTKSAGGVIGSELAGTLSPSTQANIGNYAAARGVSLGQPNSGLSNLIGMNITGNTTEGLQNEGLGNYGSFANLLGSQQESPSLLAGLAETNATNAAAPDPSAVRSR